MDKSELHRFIDSAITEDIGDGDHTSLSCIPKDARGSAKLLVKGDGVIAGVELAKEIFAKLDPTAKLDIKIKDGEKIEVGQIAFTVEANIQKLLLAERLVLNCMQRMSGIATETKKYVDKIRAYNSKVLDTRKTTPNCRIIEKWAVRIGGGTNHRYGLYDMIMIKDNHVDYAGGISQAIDRANKYLNDTGRKLKIEIETRNLDEVEEALNTGGIDRIMLDNFMPSTMSDALKLINKKIETEASGGITLETIADYAATGVDFISVGALTHSFESIDLSLKAID
ncbi:MAG: carboxylating nicotinate-nucleotide diphosphorylase [Bacteroidia bacterium]|nr:carboxylating nicotinate-nucleotide diphosphorylase [Bacteroidia bacterium]